MLVQLNEKTAEMVCKLAMEQGLSADEVVQKIVDWYFEDCEKDISLQRGLKLLRENVSFLNILPFSIRSVYVSFFLI